MGKIKDTIIKKPEREAPIQRPASVRRARRASLRGKSRSTAGKVRQFIPPVIELKLAKKHQYFETVVHEGGGVDKKSKTSERKVKRLTAPLSSVRARKLVAMAGDKMGKVRVIPGKTVWHNAGITV